MNDLERLNGWDSDDELYHPALRMSIPKPKFDMPLSDKPLLQSMPSEIRWKIFCELASDGELFLGPGGCLDIATILETCKGIRQEAIPAFEHYCTVGVRHGHPLPYFPSYLRSNKIRHLAIHSYAYSIVPMIAPTAVFPNLESFKVVYDGSYLLLTDWCFKMAHQMAPTNPPKKQLLTYLFYMMDSPHSRVGVTHVPSYGANNSAWAARGNDLYEIHFEAWLSHSDFPHHEDKGIAGVSVCLSLLPQRTNPDIDYALRCYEPDLADDHVTLQARRDSGRVQERG